MGNVLSIERCEQVVALGRLGWSLRRIEQATGVRRETAGDYLRLAGVAMRAPGGWGHHSSAKPSVEVTTGSGDGSGAQDSKPAITVTTDSGGSRAANDSKQAIGVTTGFLKGKAASRPAAKSSVSACEPYRELIGLEIEWGRNAMGIPPGPGLWSRVRGRLPECEALRACAPRCLIAGRADDHRDADWGREGLQPPGPEPDAVPASPLCKPQDRTA
jgi:hypothetical protein